MVRRSERLHAWGVALLLLSSASAAAQVATDVQVEPDAAPFAAQLQPGDVLSYASIPSLPGGLGGLPGPADLFGDSAALLGDLSGDGTLEVAIGAPTSSAPFEAYGDVWICSLDAVGGVVSSVRVSANVGGFVAEPVKLAGILAASAGFGTAVAGLGDLDGDGVPDLAVGAQRYQQGVVTVETGVVWILFLNSDGTVKSQQRVTEGEAGFGGDLDDADYFGSALAAVDDLDGDGIVDLAVGASGDDDGGVSLFGRGALWMLFLDVDGTVKSESKISATAGGLVGPLAEDARLGEAVVDLGDRDGDGLRALAVGAPGFNTSGEVWVLELDAAGSVAGEHRIAPGSGGFVGPLAVGDRFGNALARTPDVDGDTRADLVVGAPRDSTGGPNRGALWLLSLDDGEQVFREHRISSNEGQFFGGLADGDGFGSALVSLGDMNGDGRADLLAGAHLSGADDAGKLWALFLHNPWLDRGESLAGTGGPPRLGGSGSLLPETPASLTLSDGLPGVTAFWVLGFSDLSAPFKGGTLVPFPDIAAPVPLDGAGGVTLPTLWPTGIPTGFEFLNQFWIPDPGGPKGFASSNALEGTTP
jgi:hypothetical protein